MGTPGGRGGASVEISILEADIDYETTFGALIGATELPELINPKGTTDTVANGTIVMTGGSITSPKAAAIRTGKAGDKVTVTGGTIHDSAIAVRLGRNNSAAAGEVIIGGDVSFSGNTVDVYLSKKSNVFTLRDDFTGRMSVKSGETLAVNEKLPITTDGTAKQMRAHVYADSKV